MHISAIEIRHLRYFVAVAEEGTFRKAAVRLHVSQPPLTRQIHQLEEVLGFSLFNRLSSGVELTAAGVVFFEEAKNILTLIEQAATRAKLTQEGQLGRLDVGIFGSAIFGVIPTIIQEFRKKNPKVEIVLHNLDRAAQMKALREQRITAGFNRFFGDQPDLSWEKVHSERMSVALPSSHALAGRASIGLADIKSESLILYPRTARPSFIDHMTHLFRAQGITPKISHEVDDMITAVALVSSGFGISVVTQSACNIHVPNVAYVPIKKSEGAVFDLDIIYRNSDNSPLLNAFLTAVRQFRERHSSKQ